MTPVQAVAPYDWGALLRLIQAAFAGMDGRIDPPSSAHRLTPDEIAAQAVSGEVWVIERGGPVACVFLEPRPGRLYLGKLAVDPAYQGRGLGSKLVLLALARARALGRPAVTLGTRVELTENHAFFARHGFEVIDRFAHPGFDRTTSLTLRRWVSPGSADPGGPGR